MVYATRCLTLGRHSSRSSRRSPSPRGCISRPLSHSTAGDYSSVLPGPSSMVAHQFTRMGCKLWRSSLSSRDHRLLPRHASAHYQSPRLEGSSRAMSPYSNPSPGRSYRHELRHSTLVQCHPYDHSSSPSHSEQPQDPLNSFAILAQFHPQLSRYLPNPPFDS